jgi:hypothetical protein
VAVLLVALAAPVVAATASVAVLIALRRTLAVSAASVVVVLAATATVVVFRLDGLVGAEVDRPSGDRLLPALDHGEERANPQRNGQSDHCQASWAHPILLSFVRLLTERTYPEGVRSP